MAGLKVHTFVITKYIAASRDSHYVKSILKKYKLFNTFFLHF